MSTTEIYFSWSVGWKSEVRVPVWLGFGDSAVVVRLASFSLSPQKDSEPALQPLLITALFPFVIVQLSHPYMATGKNIALIRQTIAGRVMPLLFNMLST